MLTWLQQAGTFCFLDNQEYAIEPHHYECIAGIGIKAFIEGDEVAKLDLFLKENGWAFGHLAYHLCASIHHLPGNKKDKIGFQPYFFFAPKVVIEIRNKRLFVHAEDPEMVLRDITGQDINPAAPFAAINTKAVLRKSDYIKKIKALQEHIRRGDCYEINFCQEFFAENVVVNPLAVYEKLVAVSPNPFSAFYRVADKYLICASPERYLQKKGTRLLSQPIKGTIKRNIEDSIQDGALKEELRRSKKDQSENVMVVDLVRNDLARICKESSVKVDELYGVYAFPQVYQMISTISGELKETTSFSEIIKATFPMGSMTGAPKHSVMRLIEEYESSPRGIFSGAVGYIRPDGDFDFNVVIRSIMYNATAKYLSYQVGSGITFYSDAEKEWEECLLKAAAIKKVLEGTGQMANNG